MKSNLYSSVHPNAIVRR